MTNKEISAWGEVLYDNSLATSILDRLLHHGEVYYLKGESYRLKDKKRFQFKTIEKQNKDKEDVDKTSDTAIWFGWILERKNCWILNRNLQESAGKYIGVVERLLIFTFILTDNLTAVGFIFTAKATILSLLTKYLLGYF